MGETATDGIRVKRKYTRRQKPKDDIERSVTGEQVKKYTISTFNLVASWTKREHWRVNRPDIEIDPWSEDAATLINALPEQYAMAFGKYGAAFSVALGLGGMVVVRVKLDAELHAERKAQTKPTKNPRGDRLITDDDIKATQQPYVNGNGSGNGSGNGVATIEPSDIVIPRGEGVPMSADSLNKLYHYQQTVQRHIETVAEDKTPHAYGLGGAAPLTPKDTRGLLT